MAVQPDKISDMRISADDAVLRYLLQWADNSLILGHRLSEWCGHGPVLEQDIAMTNIALDLIGEARNLYQHASRLEGHENENLYPYHRKERSFYNWQLVELPNGNFAETIVRQFLFDSFHYHFLHATQQVQDIQVAAIAKKSVKEAKYHLEYSSDWMLRLGDGTAESQQKMQAALDKIWLYSQACFIDSSSDQEMHQKKGWILPSSLQAEVQQLRKSVIERATLLMPEEKYYHQGGKKGIHTEHLGYILADMQYYQRTYPDATW